MEFTSQSIAAFLMIGSTAFAYFQFQKAANWNKWVGAVMALWLLALVIIGLIFHFTRDFSFPWFGLIFPLPLFVVLIIRILPKVNNLFNSLNIKTLSWIYLTRIPLILLISFSFPLEIQLHDSYYAITIPDDIIQANITLSIILSIITPVIVNFGHWEKLSNSWLFRLWNIISILLLLYYWLWETLTSFNAISAYTILWVLGFLIPLLLFVNLRMLFNWHSKQIQTSSP